MILIYNHVILYGSFAIKIKLRDIVNHMIRHVLVIANYPYNLTVDYFAIFDQSGGGHVKRTFKLVRPNYHYNKDFLQRK